MNRHIGPSYGQSGDSDPGGVVHQEHGNDCRARAAAGSPLFSGIPPDDCARIFASARVRELTRGEILYVKGGLVGQVYVLCAGSVKTNTFGRGGVEAILKLAVPGDVIGVTGLFSMGKHATTAQVSRSGRALAWERPAFTYLVQRFPVLRGNLTHVLAGDLVELKERFGELATEPAAPRVARQLLRLVHKAGRPLAGAIEIGVSREDLAQMTGTTLSTVNRLLSAWEARGLVSPGGESVSIRDVAALRHAGS